jgi:hypothetical protein
MREGVSVGKAKIDRTLVDRREHVLYAGVGMSGKTTLARFHAEILDDADYDLIVYDPVGTLTANGDWPERAEIFDDEEKFHKALARAGSDDPERPIFVFVDEAADIFGHSQTDAHKIPRVCRHNGVFLRMIVQRPKAMHPSARTQTTIAYMFRLAQDDARMICADFGHGADVYTVPLDRGDFLLLESGCATVSQHKLNSLVPSFNKPQKGKAS